MGFDLDLAIGFAAALALGASVVLGLVVRTADRFGRGERRRAALVQRGR